MLIVVIVVIIIKVGEAAMLGEDEKTDWYVC